MAKSVVLLRSNPVCPDPPVEKIAKVLLETGFSVTIVAWDRDERYRQRCDDLVLPGGVAKNIRFGIPAMYGGGLRRSAAAQIAFQRNLYSWLRQHRSEYDVIHAFDFDTGFVASKVAEKYKKQFVYHILDFYADSHSLGTGVVAKTVKATELEIVNHSDATIVCSEARKEQIEVPLVL